MNLIAEAQRLLERLEQAQLDQYYAYADYDTPAGAPLPPAAMQRLARLTALRERAEQRLERRDIAARLLAEAGQLVEALEEAQRAIIDDCAGMNPADTDMARMRRLEAARMRAAYRLERRRYPFLPF